MKMFETVISLPPQLPFLQFYSFFYYFFYFAFLLLAVDVISAIEFDKNGDHLAVGDRGGRVVIFQDTGGKDVRISILFPIIVFSFPII